MHDPNYNYGKPLKLKKKSTSVYRREMYPEPTPEEKVRTNVLFIHSSILRRRGERVNALAHKEESLTMNKVASNNRKLQQHLRAEQRINEATDKMALKSGGGHLYSGVDQELMLRKRRVDLGQMKKTVSY